MNQNPNVISIPDATKHLTSALSLFRTGETEPLIIGDDNHPEAALIPYEQFQRLVEYDTQARLEDQQELLQRRQESIDHKVERDFHELLTERGFASLNEFMIHMLKADRAEKNVAEHKALVARMWPNGAPKPGDES
jgi:PHD/YefM family antitoxin component YafN of YafNO toxin-antitoxin module